MQPVCLEDLLAADHLARTVWSVVERLDLSKFEASLQARGSDPGRSATDPRVLVALWLYAATQGVGSGRELARLCECHDAYRWLCGGLSLNYHTLNDFRVGHGEALDAMFAQVLAALMMQGAVTLDRVSQDGTRVRASAGRSSFRRRQTLEDHLEKARRHLEDLKRQMDDPGQSLQKRVARERAARERLERVELALNEIQKIEQAKAAQKQKPSRDRPARASTTEPEARILKMGNGGFDPAHNVQLATDVESRAIVGVQVHNAGSDANLDAPMREAIERQTGRRVREHLMDGGFVTLAGIDRADTAGVTVYAPVPTRRHGGDPYEVRRGDSRAIGSWRQRMRTASAQSIYAQRASTSETVNGDLKTFRGLSRCMVRGLRKVRCVALWSALAYNVMHFASILAA